MDFFSILTLFGGLAMFLYGMDIMGDGLKKLSGSKLEMILEKLTSNRIKGFLLGAGVTAVIQSSSTTTVMLVGFVNSGIMKLSQTISIIMGANIGTTITAWILSLSSISGESFIIQLLKPSSFTPILAMIGIIMSFTAKRDKQKDIGSILLGFSVLMFGMETMSSSMAGLKDSPFFAKLLVMFS
ncbi:MAG: Na/Pi symporter, partial [Firmicutes bacterium]|nr:Na/Pi symporter [Bacillota bacterium]